MTQGVLMVLLILLLIISVASAVYAVVLLKKALDAETSRDTTDHHKSVLVETSGQSGKEPRPDQSKAVAKLLPGKTSTEGKTRRDGAADEQVEALYKRGLALQNRIHNERHSEDFRRYKRTAEMVVILERLDLDRSGIQIIHLEDEETPTVTAFNNVSLAKIVGAVGRIAVRPKQLDRLNKPLHGRA